jgi:uncharacterized protein YqeY
MSLDAADIMKDRLRADLKAAMIAKDAVRVSVLRSLVATLDNAQAAPVGDGHERYRQLAFGDPGVEVPRLVLSQSEVRALFAAEADSRRAAAGQMKTLGQAEAASRLLAEAEIVAGYMPA